MNTEKLFKNSSKGKNCKLYDGSKILDSTLSDNCIVGDFSRVTSSYMGTFSKLDRNNLLYYSEINNYSYTGQFTIIQHTKIGKFCSISWGVTIGPGEHDYKRISSHDFVYNDHYGIKPKNLDEPFNRYKKNLVIGNDVWIGANSTILRGVTIGNGAVIGANAIVNKDIPPYAIAVGNPAKIINYRFSDNIIQKLEETKWWNFSHKKLQKHFFDLSSKDINKAIENLLDKDD